MLERQLADIGRSRRRPAVETVLEDRIDAAVGAGAELETAPACSFEPAGAVVPGEPQNAQTGSEPLLRMRPTFENDRLNLAVSGPMAAASCRMRSTVQPA